MKSDFHDIFEIIKDAHKQGITLFIEDDKLKFLIDKGKGINGKLLCLIKDHKQTITEFLRKPLDRNTDFSVVLPRPSTNNNIPLSYGQERLWFIDQFEGSVQYHMPWVVDIVGRLNQEALGYAMNEVVNRHEILRTVIREDDGKAFQQVLPKDSWKMEVIEAGDSQPETMDAMIGLTVSRPFDLANDHMMRASLIRVSDEHFILATTIHHIASDGWSMGILVSEVISFFNSFTNHRPSGLQPLAVQYADFAVWQRTHLPGILGEQLTYWKGQLSGTTPLSLPADYVIRPAIQSTRGAMRTYWIDKELSADLQKLSQQQGTTLFMTLLSAFQVLLHRYTAQTDICVGTPIANRTRQEIEPLIGFFVNTLALRSDLSDNPRFDELLKQVRQTTLDAYEHQDVPFEKIVEAIIQERDLSRSPLFQVMFSLENTPPVPELRLGEVSLKNYRFAHRSSKFEMTFAMSVHKDGIWGSVEYCTDLYKDDTIDRMIGHYKELLRSVVKNPSEKIGQLSMLTAEEGERLLYEFPGVRSGYPREQDLVQLLDRAAGEHADKTAVVFGGERLSYKELHQSANRLSNVLVAHGVGRDVLVPVCMDKGMDMIIALIAVLKAGGAYVPIDPDYPLERIQFILEDTASRAKVIITTEDIEDDLVGIASSHPILSIDSVSVREQMTNATAPSRVIGADDLAYVIYTSGSTGKPKGVLIEHKNVVRLFFNDRPLFDFNDKDVWTLFHSFAFDFSVWEMYGALLLGGRLVIIDKDTARDTSAFARVLAEEQVTVLNQTPSAFYALQEQVMRNAGALLVRYVIFGGEALTPSRLREWKNLFPECKLINMYGITETTVHVTYQELLEHHLMSASSIVGKAIPTLRVYVLDNFLNPVPVGVIGELYIEGAGVGRGYLNRAELTAERFIRSPFNGEERLYKTGDLGRWLSEGSIEYFGRADEQLKIRGYRIEPAEVEYAMEGISFIDQAVVLGKSDSASNKRLVGYVKSSVEIDRNVFLEELKQRLPEHMIPSVIVQVESFPLTSNGKIDKKKMLGWDLQEMGATGDYTAPSNAIESALSEIWEKLLEVERVGIHDNFFQLGGDSIISIQAVSRAKQQGYHITPKDMFLYQTIGALASVIKERNGKSSDAQAEQGLLWGRCGLLPIQEWYFDKNSKNREGISHYNQSTFLDVDKSISEQELSEGLKVLINHHDALRFRYEHEGDHWRQVYTDQVQRLEICDVSGMQGDMHQIITEKTMSFQRSVDIIGGPIIRVVLFKTADAEKCNRLLIIVHHLAIDGVSWRIIMDDLSALLIDKAKSLGRKCSSVRQWHSALQQYSKSARVTSQRDFWQDAHGKFIPLPVDLHSDEAITMDRTETYTITLGQEQTSQLLQVAPQAYHTQINDLLLAALTITFTRWTSHKTVVVGLEGHGREDIDPTIDISKTVGWFTTLYPVAFHLDSDNTDQVIKSVKEQLRRVPEKGLGYGLLRYMMQDDNLRSEQPWEVVFNYLGQFDNVNQSGQVIRMANESPAGNISDHQRLLEKISINGAVVNGMLSLSWTFSRIHYQAQTIPRLAENYKEDLERIIDHCLKQVHIGTINTPSDFGLQDHVSHTELDKFMNKAPMNNILEF